MGIVHRQGGAAVKPTLEQVASVACFKNGMLLMGQRADDKKWCCPGGHLEEGESPLAAARREVMEETGLKALNIQPMGKQDVKNGEIRVHSFRAEVDDTPSNADDPDAEFIKFRWVDPERMPEEVMKNLHNKKDVTLGFLGIQGKPWSTLAEAA